MSYVKWLIIIRIKNAHSILIHLSETWREIKRNEHEFTEFATEKRTNKKIEANERNKEKENHRKLQYEIYNWIENMLLYFSSRASYEYVFLSYISFVLLLLIAHIHKTGAHNHLERWMIMAICEMKYDPILPHVCSSAR